MTDLVPAQTSVPDWLMTYCRQLADVHYQRKLNVMYVHMLEGFLANQPWKAMPPFPWHLARVHRVSKALAAPGVDLGWVPMNMMIPSDLVNRLKSEVELVNINDPELERVLSLRTFLYTAVCWWCKAVYPYQGPGILHS